MWAWSRCGCQSCYNCCARHSRTLLSEDRTTQRYPKDSIIQRLISKKMKRRKRVFADGCSLRSFTARAAPVAWAAWRSACRPASGSLSLGLGSARAPGPESGLLGVTAPAFKLTGPLSDGRGGQVVIFVPESLAPESCQPECRPARARRSPTVAARAAAKPKLHVPGNGASDVTPGPGPGRAQAPSDSDTDNSESQPSRSESSFQSRSQLGSPC